MLWRLVIRLGALACVGASLGAAASTALPVAEASTASAVEWTEPAVVAQAASADAMPAPTPAAPAAAAPAQRGPRLRYVLGVVGRASADRFKLSGYSTGLRPVAAIEYGRFRVSTSRGYALLDHGLRDPGTGAAATLAETDRLQVSLSLGIDRGRDAATLDRVRHVPGIAATVRGRLRLRYQFHPRWSGGVALSQDLLGKGGGLDARGWLGHEWRVSQRTLVTLGASASWGSGAYMRSQFGVPAGVTAFPGYASFVPRAGLYATQLGVDVTHALSRRWVVFGGAHLSRLHRDAARSPLVLRRQTASLSVGLAWRCCH